VAPRRGIGKGVITAIFSNFVDVFSLKGSGSIE
jgi:hypothetical protein